MKYFIVTGASRGLGESLALQLMDKGHHLFCISRKENGALVAQAAAKECQLDYYAYDLALVEGLEGLMEEIFKKIDLTKATQISLVNNAGMVAPMKAIGNTPGDQLAQNLHVNLAAPMILTSAFIRFTQRLSLDKRVINISSGAGKRPFYGWGAYCSAKAGIDMFTQCVALEQKEMTYPVKILSLGPGIMDTAMQEEIRSTQPEDFINVENFRGYHQEGKLVAPNQVAGKIIKLLTTENFPQGAITSVSEIE